MPLRNFVTLGFNFSLYTKVLGVVLVSEEVKRLEQLWLVLSDLFQDLNRKDISVDVASELRSCKTLICFIQTSTVHPSKELTTIDGSLQKLQQILGRIQSSLISAALTVDEGYVRDWTSKIDKAERGEINYTMVHTPSEFVPGLPRDVEEGWVRLTLQKPIGEERVQDVAEQFGVIVEFKDEFHIIISGRKASVKKAVRDVYELSLE
ncbi:MAG: DUF2096 domain-containing protein [Candidatus Bathyarchaeota archaeon]|nr:DUF2096 domain-containing protein [Candidatus Bathyarchaeota archaeon]